ncbi:MAG: hypothetical protein VR69_00175 [Peptococcaceae bacterium BRH_c4b]|nr:MAG: hypothetical protein VR69_00175 [Peptococcaceae bacterium BRH_c4b]
MIYSLIDQLNSQGVALSLDDKGHLKATLPWPVKEIPSNVLPMLQRVKTSRAEVEEVLSWDEEKSFTVYRAAIRKMGATFGKLALGSLPWARRHRPELEKVVRDAEQAFCRAHNERDMPGVRAASAAMEKAGMVVCVEFKKAADEVRRRREAGNK